MATIRVDVTSRIPLVTAVVRQRAAEAVAKAARDIEAHAKTLAPVDTGLLKNSINARQESSHGWVVESPVDYAAYVEFGTRRMAPRPHIVPAVELVRPQLVAALSRLV